MRKSLFTSLALVFALAAAGSAKARKKPANKPGQFDYYVMSLSWSPQHCADQPSDRFQCAGEKKFGFVLHGLWPQYDRGGYPQKCVLPAPQLDKPLIKSMLGTMPSDTLVRHEWEVHGTCDGAPADDYFAKAQKAYDSVMLPEQYNDPARQVTVKLADFKKALLQANPSLQKGSLAVKCKGKYVQEVRVCLTTGSLEPRGCAGDVRDECSATQPLILRRLR